VAAVHAQAAESPLARRRAAHAVIGRKRGCQGVSFGGISARGIVPNRKALSGALAVRSAKRPASCGAGRVLFPVAGVAQRRFDQKAMNGPVSVPIAMLLIAV
jgi:hypothetical protein